MAHAPLSSEQFGEGMRKMRPSALLPHVEDRLSDPVQRAHVEELAQRISRQGYRSGQHDAFQPKNSGHIHLVHTDTGSFVNNGNHRVTAMGLIGYDKPVPVRVTDLRGRG